MKASIVVGSGLAGCMVARCIAETGAPVVLIDEATSPGGLLGSATGPRGLPVDYGTHYVLDTGPRALVDHMLEVMDPADWITFTGNLPEASYFRGVMDHDSGCLDAKLLEEQKLWQGIRETLERVERTPTENGTLERTLSNSVGPTITEEVYAPVMHKLFTKRLSDLGPSAMKTIVPMRIRMFEGELSRALKKIPRLDKVLAYEKRWDHPTDIVKYYPRRGGVGRWVTDFLDKLRDMGAEVRLGNSVASFDLQGNRIVRCGLKSGESIDVDRVYWTVSPAVLAKSLSVALPSDLPPPSFRDLFLVHFAYRGHPATEAHYVYNFDPDALPYRITLYSNITNTIGPDGIVHGTAECLIDPAEDDPESESVMTTLIEMGLFAEPFEILETTTHRRRRAMVIPDLFLHERAGRMSDAVYGRCGNCSLIGTAREPMFGQHAILDDVAKVLGLPA